MSNIGWLVERGQSEKQAPPVWWSGLDADWTTDANRALRFATRPLAEAFIADGMPGLQIARAVEHGWTSEPRYLRFGELGSVTAVTEAAERITEWAKHHEPWDPLGLFTALDEAVLAFKTKEYEFPDHTHRWKERSQDELDSEHRETGAMLSRWYCPGCYEETDVQPDHLRGSGAGLDEHVDAIAYALDAVDRTLDDLPDTPAVTETMAALGEVATVWSQFIEARLAAALSEREA